MFERYLFVLRPQGEHGPPSVDAWAGKVNAIVKRVDALEASLGANSSALETKIDENSARVDEKICALEATIEAKIAQVLQALELLNRAD